MRESRGDRIFNGFTICIVILVALACLLPFLYIVAVSFSGKNAVLRSEVFLWPVEFDLKAYRAVFNSSSLIRSMWFTIGLTAVYTFISLFVTVLCAYPLSRPYQRFRPHRFSLGADTAQLPVHLQHDPDAKFLRWHAKGAGRIRLCRWCK